MTATTQQMRNMIAFIRLNIRNFDDGVGDEAHAYLTKALDMFEDAANQLDAMQAKLDAVPVDAIRWFMKNAILDGPSGDELGIREEIETWIETQVTP